jgi:hypothetical protein
MKLPKKQNFIVAYSSNLTVKEVYYSPHETDQNIAKISQAVDRKFIQLGEQYMREGGNVVVITSANLATVMHSLPNLDWSHDYYKSELPLVMPSSSKIEGPMDGQE